MPGLTKVQKDEIHYMSVSSPLVDSIGSGTSSQADVARQASVLMSQLYAMNDKTIALPVRGARAISEKDILDAVENHNGEFKRPAPSPPTDGGIEEDAYEIWFELKLFFGDHEHLVDMFGRARAGAERADSMTEVQRAETLEPGALVLARRADGRSTTKCYSGGWAEPDQDGEFSGQCKWYNGTVKNGGPSAGQRRDDVVRRLGKCGEQAEGLRVGDSAQVKTPEVDAILSNMLKGGVRCPAYLNNDPGNVDKPMVKDVTTVSDCMHCRGNHCKSCYRQFGGRIGAEKAAEFAEYLRGKGLLKPKMRCVDWYETVLVLSTNRGPHPIPAAELDHFRSIVNLSRYLYADMFKADNDGHVLGTLCAAMSFEYTLHVAFGMFYKEKEIE